MNFNRRTLSFERRGFGLTCRQEAFRTASHTNPDVMRCRADTLEALNAVVNTLIVGRLNAMHLGDMLNHVKYMPVSRTRGCDLNVSVGECIAMSNPWSDVNGVSITYIPAIHTIQVERGALRAPFFNAQWPQAMQLVTVGYKIALAYAHSLNPASTHAIKTCMFPSSSDRDDLFAAYLALSVIMDGIYTEAPAHRQVLLTMWAQIHCQGGHGSNNTYVRATNETLSRLGGFYSTFKCPVTPLLTGSNACIKSKHT